MKHKKNIKQQNFLVHMFSAGQNRCLRTIWYFLKKNKKIFFFYKFLWFGTTKLKGGGDTLALKILFDACLPWLTGLVCQVEEGLEVELEGSAHKGKVTK